MAFFAGRCTLIPNGRNCLPLEKMQVACAARTTNRTTKGQQYAGLMS